MLRKLTLVQSCSVAGCDTVVTVVQELFAVICVNLPSPIQNVTKWLDIIEIILNHLNKTNPEPPPDDTTSPQPESKSASFYVFYPDASLFYLLIVFPFPQRFSGVERALMLAASLYVVY